MRAGSNICSEQSRETQELRRLASTNMNALMQANEKRDGVVTVVATASDRRRL